MSAGDPGRVVAKESYFSPQYVELEYRRLWPRVWQMACREEELENVGDYVTYDIGAESVVVLRSAPDRLRAFHNACQHRGRRLTDGCGAMRHIVCRFHGWSWNLDGENVNVTQREEFLGRLEGEDLGLKPVRLDTWGGFVFITLDPHAEPLDDYLGEAAEILAPFELERMRYRWRKWLVLPANWKVALEAFNEGYHVGVTHYGLPEFGIAQFSSRSAGRHGTFGSEVATGTLGSNRSQAETADVRQELADFYRYMKRALDSNMTDTLLQVADQLPSTVPASTPPDEVVERFMGMAIAADAARGVEWPKITPEQYREAGIDWHIFPNMVLLPMATNCLGYRARPNGQDPDSCIFEVYQLERMPPGAEPEVENLRNDDVHDEAFWGEILLQDFQQMEGTHRGIKSSGFAGPRLNPTQELAIANFHRVYHEYLGRS